MLKSGSTLYLRAPRPRRVLIALIVLPGAVVVLLPSHGFILLTLSVDDANIIVASESSP